MQSVKSALEDADVALLLMDIRDSQEECNELFASLKLKVPAIVVINKIDTVKPQQIEAAKAFFARQPYCKKVVAIAALQHSHLQELLDTIVDLLPEGDAFYDEEDLTDLPTKFFVGEMVREKVFELFGDEIPYHTTVLVNEFKEKETLIKIQADIIVQRESQKAILIGENGKMIKKIGSLARADIESFLQRKVFLELFVKVRPKWRDNELYLKEYGYY